MEIELSPDNRPHIIKTRQFIDSFPFTLESTEWRIKWPVKNRPWKTYNPDFWCQELRSYIELATSKSNVSENAESWRQILLAGYPLRVFWWQGQEITGHILDETFHETGLGTPYALNQL